MTIINLKKYSLVIYLSDEWWYKNSNGTNICHFVIYSYQKKNAKKMIKMNHKTVFEVIEIVKCKTLIKL